MQHEEGHRPLPKIHICVHRGVWGRSSRVGAGAGTHVSLILVLTIIYDLLVIQPVTTLRI